MKITVPGVTVGHWTDPVARTGCTVVRFADHSVASGEVRGGAPATREFMLLDPTRTVCEINAVVLSGGSAFGLSAAEGVIERLEADGVGFVTRFGRVPIVVAMSLFDLGVGSSDVRPDPAAGAAALAAATDRPAVGAVGAGAGATVGKWRPPRSPGGLGISCLKGSGFEVLAVVAVNAAGDIRDGLAEAAVADGTFAWQNSGEPATVIGVVVTDARLDKVACHLLSQGAHDGLARAISPPHSSSDGDAFVAAATGTAKGSPRLDEVRFVVVCAVEQAIRTCRGPADVNDQ